MEGKKAGKIPPEEVTEIKDNKAAVPTGVPQTEIVLPDECGDSLWGPVLAQYEESSPKNEPINNQQNKNETND